MAMQVRDNAERSRYELLEDGTVIGVADYRLTDSTVVIPHTEIARDRRGQGLGDVLVRGALDELAGSGREVVPACWFVADFIDRHPEYQAQLRADELQ